MLRYGSRQSVREPDNFQVPERSGSFEKFVEKLQGWGAGDSAAFREILHIYACLTKSRTIECGCEAERHAYGTSRIYILRFRSYMHLNI